MKGIGVVKRIHIIGSVASGKSTLARKLCEDMNIAHYELDNIMWERGKNGDRRRSEEERRTILSSIVSQDSWIVEGVHHHEWMWESLEQSDLIIFLDTPKQKRTYRIIKRFIEEKAGLRKGNYKQTIHMLLKMFEWSRRFENEEKETIIRLLKPHDSKVKVM
ncbi:DNA topology modulation protein FlaR [Rossellomorea aquimaris]|uniref:DNA topology modulation protein FlaR n=1 Tax=Rossellomorea aquimaris TaxID=189382 RepID=A0A1J6WLA5_9BACI|nr:DNA topology modulation protein FlaR [Rossellomorea aquimaris]